MSVDEMTGIQALEHKYPDKPVMSGKSALMEFEYIRHGTTSLIGFFDVAAGRMEFLHDQSHRIRFVYTPKHCSWINQIEIWFGIINRRLLKRKSYVSVQELESSILRFIEQYNVSAHPFKWTYKGVPLTV